MKIMKKTGILLAAAAILVAAVSCNKDQDYAPQGVKLNITVADLEQGTKAIKTGWTSGDKINIWFDGAEALTPHLIITYDGSKWVPGTINPTAEAALKTDDTGTFRYLYEATNDLSAYEKHFGYQFAFPHGTINSQDYFSPVLALGSPRGDLNYSFDGTTLTLNLSGWMFITNAQIVVTGLSGNPEDWCLKMTTGSSPWYSIQDLRNLNSEDHISFGYSDSHASRGTANADGVAFYFRSQTKDIYNVSSTSPYADHTFTLYNATESYQFVKAATPIASAYYTANPGAGTYDVLDHTFTAIKIPFSKFNTL